MPPSECSDDSEVPSADEEEAATLVADTNSKRKADEALKLVSEEACDDFGDMREFFDLCVETWRAAYNPGTTLTADESMVFWVGTGSAHLTYLPRKPTPLGIMLKTICDASSGVMVGAEICESKEAMAVDPHDCYTLSSTGIRHPMDGQDSSS